MKQYLLNKTKGICLIIPWRAIFVPTINQINNRKENNYGKMQKSKKKKKITRENYICIGAENGPWNKFHLWRFV